MLWQEGVDAVSALWCSFVAWKAKPHTLCTILNCNIVLSNLFIFSLVAEQSVFCTLPSDSLSYATSTSIYSSTVLMETSLRIWFWIKRTLFIQWDKQISEVLPWKSHKNLSHWLQNMGCVVPHSADTLAPAILIKKKDTEKGMYGTSYHLQCSTLALVLFSLFGTAKTLPKTISWASFEGYLVFLYSISSASCMKSSWCKACSCGCSLLSWSGSQSVCTVCLGARAHFPTFFI